VGNEGFSADAAHTHYLPGAFVRMRRWLQLEARRLSGEGDTPLDPWQGRLPCTLPGLSTWTGKDSADVGLGNRR